MAADTIEPINVIIRHPLDVDQSIEVQTSPDSTVEQLANQVAIRLELKPGSITFDLDGGDPGGLVDEIVSDGGTLVALPRAHTPVVDSYQSMNLGFVAPAAEAETNLDRVQGWGETTVILDEDLWSPESAGFLSSEEMQSDAGLWPMSYHPPNLLSPGQFIHGPAWTPQPAPVYPVTLPMMHPPTVAYVLHIDASTRDQVFRLGVSGAPASMLSDMQHYIHPGTRLFLYDTKLKTLMGPLLAVNRAEHHLVPTAFRGRFPAQIQFQFTDWFSTCQYPCKLKIGAVTPEFAAVLQQQLMLAHNPSNQRKTPKSCCRPPKRDKPLYDQSVKHVVEVNQKTWKTVTSDFAVKQLSSELRTRGHAVHVRLNRHECTIELSSSNQESVDLAINAVAGAQQRSLDRLVVDTDPVPQINVAPATPPTE
eukprot:TRINITY_DN8944_c0_g1_i1.p1 TRINITY_DN8944_c0_g1~~TRINITY_DN8944_c0_g1_i1.p1  ORF type:complete len:421 (+),score=16.58 TRINITY_DN8944_c0_g1_i1:240-1502(+)